MNMKGRGQISGVRCLPLKPLDLGIELRFLGLYSKCFCSLIHLAGEGLFSFLTLPYDTIYLTRIQIVVSIAIL